MNDNVESDVTFETMVGVKQCNALACLLINIALEKVVLVAELNIIGIIFNKP